MAAFEPVTDKAELQKLLEQLVAECEEEVARDEQRGASEAATEAAKKNASGWRTFQNERAPPPSSSPKGGRSMLDIRLDKKK